MDLDYEKVFKRKFAERYEDELNVLKTQAVALPDRRALFLITMTKAGKAHVREGLIMTLMRIGPMKSWIDLAERVSSVNPAESLRLSHLGYAGEDYRLYWNKKHSLRANYKKFFRNRFSRALHYKDFLEKIALHRKLGINFIYPMEYEGLSLEKDLDKFENDRWYEVKIRTCVEGRKRKPPRVIM